MIYRKAGTNSPAVSFLRVTFTIWNLLAFNQSLKDATEMQTRELGRRCTTSKLDCLASFSQLRQAASTVLISLFTDAKIRGNLEMIPFCPPQLKSNFKALNISDQQLSCVNDPVLCTHPSSHLILWGPHHDYPLQ
jgi:hypothetical protein